MPSFVTLTADQVRAIGLLDSEPGHDRHDWRNLVSRLREAVEHWRNYANDSELREYLEFPKIPPIRVRIDIDSTSVAGVSYNTVEPLVRFHPHTLEFYPRNCIQQTAPHEVAHTVVSQWWEITQGVRVKGHGKQWRRIMGLFGKPPYVYHRNSLLPRFGVPVTPLQCRCRVRWFTEKQIGSGKQFACPKCKHAYGPVKDDYARRLDKLLNQHANRKIDVPLVCKICRHEESVSVTPDEASAGVYQPCPETGCIGTLQRHYIL